MYNCTKCPYIIYPFKAVIVQCKSCNCSQCKLKVSPTDEPNQLTVETINLILCIESQIHIHEYLTHTLLGPHSLGVYNAHHDQYCALWGKKKMEILS